MQEAEQLMLQSARLGNDKEATTWEYIGTSTQDILILKYLLGEGKTAHLQM